MTQSHERVVELRTALKLYKNNYAQQKKYS